LRLLLDTHALLWGVLDDPHLSPAAHDAMIDPDSEIAISAVSIYEITLKHRLGKLEQAAPFVLHHKRMLADLQWIALPVTLNHAALAGGLDISHRDPFDRLLIAQARLDRLTLVSNDALFDAFGVDRLW
jgi:PIN domain nuclease of toxin-antitoxin system